MCWNRSSQLAERKKTDLKLKVGDLPKQTCLGTEVRIGSDQSRHVAAPVSEILILLDPQLDSGTAVSDHCFIQFLR